MLFEFLVFISFISIYISSVKRKWSVRVIALVYIGILIFIGIKRNHVFFIYPFFLVESLFLVIPCLLYFYELFIHIHPEPLKNQPSFWVITGILFLNAWQYSLPHDGKYARKL